MVNNKDLLKNFDEIPIAPSEFECRFYLWDPTDEQSLKTKLKKLKGRKVHNKMLMSRYIFGLANERTPGFVRVRKEHNKVTMTSKRYDCQNCDLFPSEVDITVNDFQTAYNLLRSLGLKQKSYQETKREKWTLPIPGVKEIVFDEIPGLPPYVEIDCTTNRALSAAVKKLGLNPKDAKYGPYSNAFEELYGINRKLMNHKMPELTFTTVKTVVGPLVKKNYASFQKYS
jgi:adenylate cyclase class 2